MAKPLLSFDSVEELMTEINKPTATPRTDAIMAMIDDSESLPRNARATTWFERVEAIAYRIEALELECIDLARDAARYHWLRDPANVGHAAWNTLTRSDTTAEEFDAAVDSALHERGIEP